MGGVSEMAAASMLFDRELDDGVEYYCTMDNLDVCCMEKDGGGKKILLVQST
jgi:hypothetical protein